MANLTLTIKNLEDFKKVDKSLKRLQRDLENAAPHIMHRIGNHLEQDLKQSAKNAGITPFTGTLFSKGIRYEQKPKGKTGKLFIRQYGMYLDSMKPHYVSIHRGRAVLLAWARNARNARIREKANKVTRRELDRFSIYVKPKPFILAGTRKTKSRIPGIIKSERRRLLKNVQR